MTNKLPSEKIEEIIQKAKMSDPRESLSNEYRKIKAIIQYLDEQYEQQKPCEHEWEEDGLNLGAKECKICGMLDLKSF